MVEKSGKSAAPRKTATGKTAADQAPGQAGSGKKATGRTAGRTAAKAAAGRTPGTAAAGKAGYHHGDLRNALIAAAVELAVDGGPERVVLREAARRVGVSPTAAYRHFDGQADLLYAVQVSGQVALADAMEEGAARAPGSDDPGEAAEQRFMAIGRAYIHFAMERPGLYRSAFCRIPGSADDSWTGTEPGGSEPQYRAFNLLSAALDDLVAHARMPAHRRPSAEATSWAMVHGLADLILDGPLALLPDDKREAVIASAVYTTLAGLLTP